MSDLQRDIERIDAIFEVYGLRLHAEAWQRIRARLAELEAEVHAHTEALKVFEAANAELEADAERYRWLAAKARKDTAYDLYGNGAHWSIGFFAANGRHALDAAIDAARKK